MSKSVLSGFGATHRAAARSGQVRIGACALLRLRQAERGLAPPIAGRLHRQSGVVLKCLQCTQGIPCLLTVLFAGETGPIALSGKCVPHRCHQTPAIAGNACDFGLDWRRGGTDQLEAGAGAGVAAQGQRPGSRKPGSQGAGQYAAAQAKPRGKAPRLRAWRRDRSQIAPAVFRLPCCSEDLNGVRRRTGPIIPREPADSKPWAAKQRA